MGCAGSTTVEAIRLREQIEVSHKEKNELEQALSEAKKELQKDDNQDSQVKMLKEELQKEKAEKENIKIKLEKDYHEHLKIIEELKLQNQQLQGTIVVKDSRIVELQAELDQKQSVLRSTIIEVNKLKSECNQIPIKNAQNYTVEQYESEETLEETRMKTRLNQDKIEIGQLLSYFSEFLLQVFETIKLIQDCEQQETYQEFQQQINAELNKQSSHTSEVQLLTQIIQFCTRQFEFTQQSIQKGLKCLQQTFTINKSTLNNQTVQELEDNLQQGLFEQSNNITGMANQIYKQTYLMEKINSLDNGISYDSDQSIHPLRQAETMAIETLRSSQLILKQLNILFNSQNISKDYEIPDPQTNMEEVIQSILIMLQQVKQMNEDSLNLVNSSKITQVIDSVLNDVQSYEAQFQNNFSNFVNSICKNYGQKQRQGVKDILSLLTKDLLNVQNGTLIQKLQLMQFKIKRAFDKQNELQNINDLVKAKNQKIITLFDNIDQDFNEKLRTFLQHCYKQQQATRFRKDLQALKKQLNELEDGLTIDYYKSLKRFQQRLIIIQQLLDIRQEYWKDKELELKQLKEQENELQGQVNQLNNKIQQEDRNYKYLIEQLNQQIQNGQSRINSLEVDLQKKSKDQISQLQQIQDQKETIDQLETQVQELQDENSDFRTQINNYLIQNRRSSQKLEQYKSDLDLLQALEQKVKMLEHEKEKYVNESRQEIITLQQTINEQKSLIDQFEIDLKTNKREKDAIQSENEAQYNQIQKLNHDLSEKFIQLMQLRLNRQDSKTLNRQGTLTDQTNLQAKLQHKQEQLKNLQRYQNLYEEISLENKEMQSKCNEIEQTQSQLRGLRVANSELQSQIDNLSQQLAEAQNQKQQFEVENGELKSKLTLQEVEDQNEAYEQIQQQIQLYVQKNQSLENKINQLQLQLDQEYKQKKRIILRLFFSKFYFQKRKIQQQGLDRWKRYMKQKDLVLKLVDSSNHWMVTEYYNDSQMMTPQEYIYVVSNLKSPLIRSINLQKLFICPNISQKKATRIMEVMISCKSRRDAINKHWISFPNFFNRFINKLHQNKVRVKMIKTQLIQWIIEQARLNENDGIFYAKMLQIYSDMPFSDSEAKQACIIRKMLQKKNHQAQEIFNWIQQHFDKENGTGIITQLIQNSSQQLGLIGALLKQSQNFVIEQFDKENIEQVVLNQGIWIKSDTLWQCFNDQNISGQDQIDLIINESDNI